MSYHILSTVIKVIIIWVRNRVRVIMIIQRARNRISFINSIRITLHESYSGRKYYVHKMSVLLCACSI